MQYFKKFLISILTLIILTDCVPPVFVNASASDVIEIPDGQEYVALEAEDSGVTIDNEHWQVKDFAEASGGKVLSGIGAWQKDDRDITEKGNLSFQLKVKEAGLYTVWVRVYNPSDTENSMWRRFDDGDYEIFWIRGAKNTWSWFACQSVYLEEGTHRFDQIHRDPGIYWDRILISKTMSFMPNGASGEEEIEPIEQGKYYKSPTVTPPENQHPRLMFTEQEIPAIKSAIENIEANQTVYQTLLELADLETDGRLVMNNTTVNNEDTKIAGHIESAAFLYALDTEKNQAYGRTAYENYINYTNTLILSASVQDVTRLYGNMIRLGAEIYDWCYDLLTAEEKNKIYQTIMSYAVKMEIGWPPVGQSDFCSHANESQLQSDLMSFATAVYDEHPDIWDVVAGRLYQEMIPAVNFEYGYGVPNQGSDYSVARIQSSWYCMWMLRRMGYTNQYNDALLEDVMYTVIMRMGSQSMKLQMGDCWNLEPGSGLVDAYAVFLHYTYYKNPYSKYYFNMCGNGKGIPNSNFGNGALTPWLFLALNTEEVEEKTWDDLPLVYHYGDDQNSVEDGLQIRSDWKKTNANGDYGYEIGIVFSPYMIGGHQHCHSGSFQINYGSALAVDSGIYNSKAHTNPDGSAGGTGWGGYTHHNYTVKSIAHNVMLIRGDTTKRVVGQSHTSWNTEANRKSFIDDGGQIGQSNSQIDARNNVPDGTFHQEQTTRQITPTTSFANNTEMLGWDAYPDIEKPKYAYISGDLTLAYPAARVDNYFRSFVYLNLNGNGEERDEAALLVYDNMTAETEGLDKVWLLHTQEEPTISGNRISLQRERRGYTSKMTNDTLLPSNAEFEVIGGNGHEFEIDGVNLERYSTKPLSETGKWRVEITNAEENIQDDFLNVIQIGKQDSPVYDTELIQNDAYFVGTKIKDNAVFISKNKTKYKTNLQVGINQTAEGTFTYIVTGVAKGAWTIKKDGKTITTYEVAEAHPTLTFRAPAGTYTLEWSDLSGDSDRDLSLKSNINEKNHSTAKLKIDSTYIDMEHPILEKNGTRWIHVRELLDTIGYKENEYRVSEDGKTLTLVVKERTVTLKVSENPNETNALILIDGEMYAPIHEESNPFISSNFNLATYWYPISKTILLGTRSRPNADVYLLETKKNGTDITVSADVYAVGSKNIGKLVVAAYDRRNTMQEVKIVDLASTVLGEETVTVTVSFDAEYPKYQVFAWKDTDNKLEPFRTSVSVPVQN